MGFCYVTQFVDERTEAETEVTHVELKASVLGFTFGSWNPEPNELWWKIGTALLVVRFGVFFFFFPLRWDLAL